MMVVVQVDGEPVSLLVDEIGDVVEVGPGSFETPPDTLDAALRPLILGAHKLDDRPAAGARRRPGRRRLTRCP